MRHSIYAKVIGQTLWRPDPKNDPKLELVRAKLELQSNTKVLVKPSAAILIIEREQAATDFMLGQQVRITIEDTQQEMALEAGAAAGTGKGRRGRTPRPANGAGPRLV